MALLKNLHGYRVGPGEYEVKCEGISYSDEVALINIKFLNGCGCENPEGRIAMIQEYLEAIDGDREERWDKFRLISPDDRITEFILHCLANWGYIDHGSSIGSGWLSKEGKKLLNLITQLWELEWIEKPKNQ